MNSTNLKFENIIYHKNKLIKLNLKYNFSNFRLFMPFIKLYNGFNQIFMLSYKIDCNNITYTILSVVQNIFKESNNLPLLLNSINLSLLTCPKSKVTTFKLKVFIS